MSAFEPEEIEAWHEAGHAVVARLLGGRVLGLTVEDDDDAYGGRVAVEWTPATEREQAARSGRVALGGPIAEVERFGSDDLDDVHVLAAWAGDWDEVERCADAAASNEHDRGALVRAWVAEIRALLSDPRVEEHVARVADALRAHGSLDETLFEDSFR